MNFSIFTIILFFIYSWGLGYTITNFIRNSENIFERNIIRIGIGLGVFVVLGVIFNAIHIPLDWKIFLVISMILPIINIARGKIKLPKIQLTKQNIYVILALIIFLSSLFIYTSGAFKYPYLEDDDPWSHAESIKYVSAEKTVNDPDSYDFKYIDSYPPGYNILMGVLHQTSNSLMWTMKFFNALIVSLSILFFFFFAKEFIGDEKKALISMFILASIPAFLSHFIWAHSLVIMLFFPALYCLEKIRSDKKWLLPAMIIIAAIWLTQPSQTIKLTILLGIYFIIKCIYARKVLIPEFSAIFGGILISLIWWGSRTSAFLSARTTKLATATGVENITSESLWSKLLLHFSPTGGTATRVYNFNDFFFAKTTNMINNPIGLGIFISILVIIALFAICIKYKDLLKKENSWIAISIAWLIFTFLLVNSMTFNLPIGFFAFRSWMLLAIPVSLLSVVGLDYLIELGSKIKLRPQIILLIILLGILATAGYQKYSVNTAMWPAGISWTSTEELQGYVWLKTLPINTKVFVYIPTTDQFAIGFDKYSCSWCSEVVEFRKDLASKDAIELHSWLKENEYEYIIISGMAVKQFGKQLGEEKAIEIINKKAKEIIDSDKFSISHQTNGMIILRIK